jgi:hypothetical protein
MEESSDAVIAAALQLAEDAFQKLKAMVGREDAAAVLERLIQQSPELPGQTLQQKMVRSAVLSLVASLTVSDHPLPPPAPEGAMDPRPVWRISAVIEADEQEANEALDAIGRALCPEPGHPGYCPVPWHTELIRFDSLEETERSEYKELMEDQRRMAREAGEEGA